MLDFFYSTRYISRFTKGLQKVYRFTEGRGSRNRTAPPLPQLWVTQREEGKGSVN
jgi:hypothetical protein